MKKALFWIFAIAVAITLYKFPRMVESSIPTVYYITPSHKTYENALTCTGTLQAGQRYEVYVSAPAIPGSVKVSVGDRVEAGEPLLWLDPMPLLDSQTLETLRVYGGSSAVGSALPEADIASVAALYSLSSALGGGFTDYADLAELLRQTQGEDLSDVQTELADSSRGEILAPASGIVTGITARESVPALPGISLVTISDTSKYKVLAEVPEKDIARVRVGDEAQIRCTGSALSQYTGRVTKVFPTARKALRGTLTETVVDVEIELDNPDDALKPGFTAKVEILGGEDSLLITVPYEAIRQDENNDEYVYVYADGKIKKQLIVTGLELTDQVEVLQGLSADSVVIYNPGSIVREGAIINLKGRADAY